MYTDVLDDALRSLRISSSLLLREVYAPPWAVTVPDSTDLATLLNAGSPVRVVAFHLVEFGHCVINASDGESLHLNAGEMAICFGGKAHRLSLGKPAKAQPIESLLTGSPNVRRADAGTPSDQTALLCGVFFLHHTEFNPLFSALPSITHARLSRTGEFSNLSGVARLMAEEIDRRTLGGSYVVERLLEVLCAEAMRSHLENVTCEETSWFRGIKDPIIGKALAAIHGHPGDNWSVQRLADCVAMSPSRFAARFSASLGDSPMAYVTKWRMSLACRDLSESKRSVDQIAENVGYENPAAFSRTFKKHVGVSPATWRTRTTDSVTS
ncbi:MAG: AraC family transcriptional regulator [Gammaproteobacteria bacterium]|nr:AraC family transcriptional regulator [Gammaproteobacteria bacterium]